MEGSLDMSVGGFFMNTASGSGGAILAKNDAMVTIGAVQFSDNQARRGKAIAVSNSKVVLSDTLFIPSGGDESSLVYINDDEDPTVNGTTVMCDATNQPAFCMGLDSRIFVEGGPGLFANSNCIGTALDQFAKTCDIFYLPH